MTDDHIRVEQALSSWRRIEAWLAEHVPRSHRRLPPPATESEIRAVEKELDLLIPADVRAFYALHNGTGPASDFDWPVWDGPLPIPADQRDPEREPSGYFLPDGGIGPLAHLATWSDGPAGCERVDEPGQRYLPFIASDPDGLYGVFVDCTPGAGYGQLGGYAEAELPDPGQEPSFAAYLADVADALHTRRIPFQHETSDV
ncbi:SMI1/KNR4 family protein [Streptomyces flavofungini]|uniref:SMI1/KNR4 family protein n=1 Tax=Streptomyces flavofungini TaxID=68200 RepID=UPI0034DEAAF8